MKDINRITFPSIPLIHHPVEEAFKIIAEAGYKNVDIIDKPPYWSVSLTSAIIKPSERPRKKRD